MDWRNLLQGKLTYISGLCLIGLGAYQVSQGDYDGGCNRILEGLTALGLRRSISNSSN